MFWGAWQFSLCKVHEQHNAPEGKDQMWKMIEILHCKKTGLIH